MKLDDGPYLYVSPRGEPRIVMVYGGQAYDGVSCSVLEIWHGEFRPLDAGEVLLEVNRKHGLVARAT